MAGKTSSSQPALRGVAATAAAPLQPSRTHNALPAATATGIGRGANDLRGGTAAVGEADRSAGKTTTGREAGCRIFDAISGILGKDDRRRTRAGNLAACGAGRSAYKRRRDVPNTDFGHVPFSKMEPTGTNRAGVRLELTTFGLCLPLQFSLPGCTSLWSGLSLHPGFDPEGACH